MFFCLFFFRVETFNSTPHYRDRVYDPDPERSYTKTKLGKLKRSNATVESAVKQTSPVNPPFDSFPSDESTQFSEDFSILPSFGPMDAFEQVKNSSKSIKKFANAEVVINSNDKGLYMMNFVHDLQVPNNPEKHHIYLRACCWAS